MKKLLFLMAFVLISLSSYAQDLTINNDSSYEIVVTANKALPTFCSDGIPGGPLVIASGNTGVITGQGIKEWMYVRARTTGLPGYSVVSESQCSSSCGTNTSNNLTLTWDVACFEVTIEN